jgi:selenocysteine-specific elongation factor
VASAEVLARVRTLAGSVVAPGTAAPVQLRLESPAVAGRGDRLVIRSYSPAITIGGATVVDPLAAKRRRGTAAPAEAEDDAVRAAVRFVSAAGAAGLDAPTLAARVTVPLAALIPALADRAEVLSFGHDPVWLVAAEAVRALGETARGRLAEFHAAHPLQPAMSREELRRRVFARAPQGVFEAVLDALVREGRARVSGDGVALAGHAVTFTPEESRVRDAMLAAAAAAGLEGLDPVHPPASVSGDARIKDRVARALLAEGALRRVGDLLVDAARLDALKGDVRRRWPPGSRLDVGAFKEVTGLTRKFVIPLLEYLDRERVTRRAGPDRVVLGGE